MTAAMNLRFNPNAGLTTYEQSADPFRSIGFVCRKTHQIHFDFFQVNFNLARRLRCINVQDDALRAGELANARNILNHANLVIDVHHGDQNRIGADGCLQLVKINQTIGQYIQVGYFKPFPLKLTASIQGRLVLGFNGDEVLALFLIKVRRALYCQINAFSCAAGPHNLAGIGMHQLRHLIARLLNSLFCSPAKGMAA